VKFQGNTFQLLEAKDAQSYIIGKAISPFLSDQVTFKGDFFFCFFLHQTISIIYNQTVNTALKSSLAKETSNIKPGAEKQTLPSPVTMEWSSLQMQHYPVVHQ